MHKNQVVTIINIFFIENREEQIRGPHKEPNNKIIQMTLASTGSLLDSLIFLGWT